MVRILSTGKKEYDWLADYVWPNGPACPACGSDNAQVGIQPPDDPSLPRLPQQEDVHPKTGTIMARSQLNYPTWARAAYLIVTNRKGIARIHRELGLTPKSAWHLLHCWCQAYEAGPFSR